MVETGVLIGFVILASAAIFFFSYIEAFIALAAQAGWWLSKRVLALLILMEPDVNRQIEVVKPN